MHIKKVKIEPSWAYCDEDGNTLPTKVFELLQQISENGKLTDAAKHVGISYRSAWDLLNKSADFFEMPLVDMQRGRGAQLTPIGVKLLWSRKRINARLGPQIDNLASELNTEIQHILADKPPALRIHASHGYAVSLLPEFAEDFQLDLQYKSIGEAMASLNRGDCDLAGFDIPMHHVSEKIKDSFRKHINPEQHKIISFVSRQQGLILQTGNPKNIQSLKDINNPDIRFINRQKESGTRNLLDELIQLDRLDVDRIVGFGDEEFTHSAVAAYIASGMADVGFGIQAAAEHFGLGFVPITTEYYMLACRKKALELESVTKLIQVMQEPAFQRKVASLPGYKPINCGKVIEVNDIL